MLLDLIMPVMDGFEVLEHMQSKKILDKIPVIVISGETSMQIEKKCFDYGVSDFIGRPYKTALVQKRVQNMVNQYVYKNQLEEKVADQTAVLRITYIKFNLAGVRRTFQPGTCKVLLLIVYLKCVQRDLRQRPVLCGREWRLPLRVP